MTVNFCLRECRFSVIAILAQIVPSTSVGLISCVDPVITLAAGCEIFVAHLETTGLSRFAYPTTYIRQQVLFLLVSSVSVRFYNIGSYQQVN